MVRPQDLRNGDKRLRRLTTNQPPFLSLLSLLWPIFLLPRRISRPFVQPAGQGLEKCHERAFLFEAESDGPDVGIEKRIHAVALATKDPEPELLFGGKRGAIAVDEAARRERRRRGCCARSSRSILDDTSRSAHGLCMPSKTISLETDAYRLLRREKRRRESFSQVVRRLVNERPALTAGELLEALKPFEGVGAGRKRKRHAAA
jgi:hypothetical protein